jgi:hypothetical protein
MIALEDGIIYYDSLAEVKAEGRFAIPVNSIFSFFKLKGKTSILSIENLEPYHGDYLLYSPPEKRYYIKTYRGYQYKEFMDLVYGGSDPFVNNLDNWIANGHIYLLFTGDMVEDMKIMLARVYRSHLKEGGMLSYHIFIKLLEESIGLEEYKDYGRNLTGTKTVQMQYHERIGELWKKASEIKK